MARVFIAVQPPPSVYTSIDQVHKKLRSADPSVKPVKSRNLHVTVKYLGNKNEIDTEAVSEVARETTERHSKFNVELRGLSAFPTVEEPRDIWIGIGEGAKELEEIHDDLQRRLTAMDLAPKDRWEYAPHMTVAQKDDENQFKDRHGAEIRGLDGIPKYIQRENLENYGEFQIREIKLLRTTKKNGVEQNVVRKFALD